MREEEGLEGAGHPEVEEEVALLVPKEFTSSMALSTFSCICYQKSVLLENLQLNLLQTCFRNHNIGYCFEFLISENE